MAPAVSSLVALQATLYFGESRVQGVCSRLSICCVLQNLERL